MSGSGKDDKTGFFKDQKTHVSDKRVQVQMSSGKIYGPYTRDEVLSFIEKKKIRGEEKILFEGETVWRPVGTEPEFFDAIHAILSGNKPKKRETAPKVTSSEVVKPFQGNEKTRASESMTPQEEAPPHTPQLEVPAFAVETAAPIQDPSYSSEVSSLGTPPLHSQQRASTSLSSSKAPPPKSSLKILYVVVLAGVLGALYVTQQKEVGPTTDSELASSYFFDARTAPLYSKPLISALRDLKTGARESIPAAVQKTDLAQSFVYSLNAKKIIHRLNAASEGDTSSAQNTSAYWAQRAVDFQLIGLRAQMLNVKLGRILIERGVGIWSELEKRNLLLPEDKLLLDLVKAHSLGDWALVSKQASQLSSPVSDWMDSDAIWWSGWLQGVQREIPPSRGGELPPDLELVSNIRRAYVAGDSEMSTWLLQLASLEAESSYLWYVSAQINWRKSRNVQVQNAYREFIIGIGSLSLYPPSIQIAYWTQFSEFLKSYARAETHRRASENLELLRNGNIAFREGAEKKWWDIGDDGLNGKDIADEILTRSSKGMLSARDRAALEVLGSNLDKGSIYLFVVGTHLAFEGQWNDALRIFSSIVAQDPKNTDGLFGKTWALAKLFEFGEAQSLYSELSKASVGSNVHLRSKGLIHYLGREYAEAQQVFNDYLKQEPTDAWAHYFQAETYLIQDSYLGCIKSANLSKLHGKGELQFRAELLFYRCRVKGGVGIRDSLDSLAQLIRKNPDSLPLRIAFLDMMNESKLYDDAAQVLEDSLRYFPFSAKLRLAAGNIYDVQGVPGRAIEYFTQAAKLDLTSAEPWVRIGKVLLRQDKFLEAARNFEIAARLQPSYPEIYLFAARAYDNAGKTDEAAFSYAKEIDERPSAVGTFVEAAEFLLKNNAPQKIPELYRRFQAGGYQEDPRALIRLAQAYNIMGDLGNAKTFASRAVAGNPENPYANLILANVLDRAGEYSLAKRYYETYLKLMPVAEDGPSLRDKLSRPPYVN